jgi:sugar O-acyltransferase (sialic acid O-acetyltransferase NeuD family)
MKVVDVRAAEGAAVTEGDLLFVVETTNASHGVLAPASGVVRALAAVKGAMTEAGALLCGIETIAAAGRELAAADNSTPARAAYVVAANSPELSRFQAMIVGAGSHAGAVIDALAGSGWDIAGAIDDKVATGTEILPGIKVLGGDSLLPKLLADGVRVAFIGVGGAISNAPRRGIYEKLRALGFFLPPVVHRSAHVGLSAVLGEAACVMPGAVVGPRSRVGANVIVNAGAVISHDAVIGDHAHLAPGCVLGGNVTIGSESTIGMAAAVLLGVRIGRNVLVHNTASVTRDIDDNLEFTSDRRRLPRQ